MPGLPHLRVGLCAGARGKRGLGRGRGRGGAQPRVYIEAAGQLAVPLQCRHCEDAPCVQVCPSGALFRLDPESPVLVDQEKCIGCEFCVQVCPFGVIRMASDGKAIIKCDLCAGRLAQGLEPACVASCPVRALGFEEMKEDAARKRLQTALHLVERRGAMSQSQLDQPRTQRTDHACGTSLVREIIDRYGGNAEMLIPMMQDIQTAEGYLPREHLRTLAGELGVPLSRIYGVATFYASFRLQPKGEHTITLCMGTVCYLKGADRISEVIQEEFQVTPGGTSPDGKFSFAPVNCLGACALAPVMVVDGEYFGGLSAGSAVDILQKVAAGKQIAAAGARLRKTTGERSDRDDGQTRKRRRPGGIPRAVAGRAQHAAAARPRVHRHRLHGQGRRKRAGAIPGTGRGGTRKTSTVEAKCTGCHGFCERGPIVVVDPGNVFYQGVKPEDVPEIIAETALGGAARGKASLPGRPARSRPALPKKSPSTSSQQRIVLAHNGVVDPTSIDDYIAAGGYAALAKVLAGMTPEAVIEEVTRSGLRGRGGGGFLTGPEMASRPRRPRRAEVRDRQRRRRRPRRLHGPLAHGGLAPQRSGRNDHRRLRHRLVAGIHLRAERVPHGRRAPDDGHAGGARDGASGREHPGKRLRLRYPHQPRRRGIHLRRIDRPDGLVGRPRRRAPRQVHPHRRGRLPRQALAVEQRRDLGQRPAHHPPRRRLVRLAWARPRAREPRSSRWSAK